MKYIKKSKINGLPTPEKRKVESLFNKEILPQMLKTLQKDQKTAAFVKALPLKSVEVQQNFYEDMVIETLIKILGEQFDNLAKNNPFVPISQKGQV